MFPPNPSPSGSPPPYGPPPSQPPLAGVPPPVVNAQVSKPYGVVELGAAPASTLSTGWKIAIGVLTFLCLGLLASTVALAVLFASDKTPKVIRDTVLSTTGPPSGTNTCDGKKPGFANVQCYVNGVVEVLEQAGANVTPGYRGNINATESGREPISTPYFQAGLCPVNVHWHLGTEHYSLGQYDETGGGPSDISDRRRKAGKVREGFRCTRYDASDPQFTTAYDWKHCKNMEVGQTYEVHWPHSAAGACGTLNQYQTPFYDGVFCNWATVGNVSRIHRQIGVQAQIYVVVNNESYFYPDLIRGMIVDGDRGADIAIYTGSTTGTTRNNTICSAYTPITWQVDRKCHLVSASSFDKMCADMLAQRDDMSADTQAIGSRVLVDDDLAANNQQSADFTEL